LSTLYPVTSIMKIRLNLSVDFCYHDYRSKYLKLFNNFIGKLV